MDIVTKIDRQCDKMKLYMSQEPSEQPLENPHYFDAHTHLQFAGYDVDRDAVIQRVIDADVWMINVGTQKDTSMAAIALAEKYPEIMYAAIGLHPIHTTKSYHDADELGGGEAAKSFTSRGEEFDMDLYRELARHPKVVAIGECGFDYFHLNEDEPKEEQIQKQKDAFLAQIDLSKEFKKPLMIHCRNAFPDLIEFLRPHVEELAPGIVHFFTGTPDDARQLADMGFSFTFGGAITFPPKPGRTHGNYDEAIKLIPSAQILSETDAPYVTPMPYRGQRNEPVNVIYTVAKLAELKGISPEEMKALIWANAKRVFGV
jgi:TatD DNase family protein